MNNYNSGTEEKNDAIAASGLMQEEVAAKGLPCNIYLCQSSQVHHGGKLPGTTFKEDDDDGDDNHNDDNNNAAVTAVAVAAEAIANLLTAATTTITFT